MTDFWNDKERLMRLAGMVESHDDKNDEEAEQELDWRFDRERLVVSHVKEVFAKLGIEILDHKHAVMYDEHPGREVTVLLDDVVGGYPISKLAELYQTGMADEFNVEAHDATTLRIKFRWKPI